MSEGLSHPAAIPGPAQLSGMLAPIYARAQRRGQRMGWKQRLTSVWRPLYAPFEEILPWVPEGASVLDIGCGSGAFLFLAHAVRHAAPVFGIDASARSIALGEAATDSPDIHFEQSMTADPARLASVSVVTMIDVLHHVPPEPRLALLELVFRSMRPGARLIIKDLDTKPAWRALANRITDYLSTRSIVNYLGSTETERLLSQAGFEIRASRRTLQYVWSHYMIVADKRS